MTLTYGTVCSGIEAPSSAVHPLGWQPLWFSEIEPFPKAVLAHHYPAVPDLGDMTALPAGIRAGTIPAPDVFIGGTPCQSFSVAGLRKGLADPRGQLTRTFVEILDALDDVRTQAGKPPAICLWENVPGVLSDKDNAFGNFLAALVGEDEPLQPAGSRWTDAGCVLGPTRTAAWRILDAQYFGVAQRRRRVFVVVCARVGPVDPVEVLLVEEGVRGDPPTRGEAREDAAADPRRGTAGGGIEVGAAIPLDLRQAARGGKNTNDRTSGGAPGTGVGEVGDPAYTVSERQQGVGQLSIAESTTLAFTTRGRGGGVASWTFRSDAMREGTAKTPSADAEGRIRLRDPGMGMYEEIAPTLDCGQPHGVAHAVAFTTRGRKDGLSIESQEELAYALKNPGAGGRSNDRMIATCCHPEVPEVVGTLSDGAHNGGGSTARTRTRAASSPSQHYPELPDVAWCLQHRDAKRADSDTKPGHVIPVQAVGGFFDPAAFVKATNPHSKDEAPRREQADVSACINGWDERHNPPKHVVATTMAVRRLTPVECERLQGFPDNHTLIPWKGRPAADCPDGPRYKALGNSMAVPVIRWIAKKIERALS